MLYGDCYMMLVNPLYKICHVPLKHSGKLDQYIKFEEKMQQAVCTRFNLPFEEPVSVKRGRYSAVSY